MVERAREPDKTLPSDAGTIEYPFLRHREHVTHLRVS